MLPRAPERLSGGPRRPPLFRFSPSLQTPSRNLGRGWQSRSGRALHRLGPEKPPSAANRRVKARRKPARASARFLGAAGQQSPGARWGKAGRLRPGEQRTLSLLGSHCAARPTASPGSGPLDLGWGPSAGAAAAAEQLLLRRAEPHSQRPLPSPPADLAPPGSLESPQPLCSPPHAPPQIWSRSLRGRRRDSSPGSRQDCALFSGPERHRRPGSLG